MTLDQKAGHGLTEPAIAAELNRMPPEERRDRDPEAAPFEVSSEELDMEREAAEDRVNPGRHEEDAYERSDEALPDDEEEAIIARDPSREETRFGEI
ncbi:hypothetical protein [Rhizobium sp. SG2393]|uniref:hypothetical protein n=1 Tax=Rhizobium sp. SG2393 TaxID=3276279 RepID=UPI00366DF92B